MQEMCFRHHKTDILWLVRLPCEIKYALSQPFQNVCPFLRFQRNAICSIKTSRDKPNGMGGELRRTLHVCHETSFHCWNAGAMKLRRKRGNLCLTAFLSISQS